MSDSLYSTIHQDAYIPPNFSSLPKSDHHHIGSQDNWKCEFRHRRGSHLLGSLGFFDYFDRILAERRREQLNMCTLLSLNRNNTRYLARDKCLESKDLLEPEEVAKPRIFSASGVSLHRDVPSTVLPLPASFSARFMTGCPLSSLLWPRWMCRVMTTVSSYVAREGVFAANVFYQIS